MAIVPTGTGVILVCIEVETRDAAKHSTMHRTVPHEKKKITWLKMSIVLRLRNSDVSTFLISYLICHCV